MYGTVPVPYSHRRYQKPVLIPYAYDLNFNPVRVLYGTSISADDESSDASPPPAQIAVTRSGGPGGQVAAGSSRACVCGHINICSKSHLALLSSETKSHTADA